MARRRSTSPIIDLRKLLGFDAAVEVSDERRVAQSPRRLGRCAARLDGGRSSRWFPQGGAVAAGNRASRGSGAAGAEHAVRGGRKARKRMGKLPRGIDSPAVSFAFVLRVATLRTWWAMDARGGGVPAREPSSTRWRSRSIAGR